MYPLNKEKTSRLIVCLLIGLFAISCKKEGSTIKGTALGTTFNIVVYPIDTVPVSQLEENIKTILQDSDLYYSTYREDSELSRFNSHKSKQPFEVSKAVYDLVNKSLHYSTITEGALDITTLSLSILWGFAQKQKIEYKAPEQKEIEKALKYTGYWNITTHKEKQKYFLEKKKENSQIDLSAIAKGHIVDSISEMLEESGVLTYLVEIGGEIRVGQSKPGKDSHNSDKGRLWAIGIEKPDTSERSVQSTLYLQSMSVATSGDYRNFIDSKNVSKNASKSDQNGSKFTHIIDARSGRPVSNRVHSVTVLSEKCEFADAMATAIFVMGKKNGIRYIERKKLAVYMVYEEDEKIQEYSSSEFINLTGQSTRN